MNFFPKWLTNLLGLLLVLLVGLLCFEQIRLLSFNNQPPQTLSVSATGKVTLAPDLATLTIGVLSNGATAIDAKNKNNQKMNQVIAFIKAQHVNATDIQTSNFYASPNYNYVNGQNNITGYNANQTITVKIHHVDQSTTQLEQVVDGAVLNGANQIQGIDFSFDNDERLLNQARKQAIEKAKQKATEIAEEAGLTLGRVINVITTEPNNIIPPRPFAMMANTAARTETKPDIQPGTQEVSETVTVVFEIK